MYFKTVTITVIVSIPVPVPVFIHMVSPIKVINSKVRLGYCGGIVSSHRLVVILKTNFFTRFFC